MSFKFFNISHSIRRITKSGIGVLAGITLTTFLNAASYSGVKLNEPSTEIAVVANAVGGTISLVDLDALKVVKTIDVIPDGPSPSIFQDFTQYFGQSVVESSGGLNYAQDTDVSPDGRTLYVSRGHRGDVVAIDIENKDLIWREPISGFRADHMDLSPDGQYLYVSAMIKGGEVVEVFRAEDGKKMTEYDSGIWPHDVHVIGETLYVSSMGNMRLSVEERRKDPAAYLIKAFDLKSGAEKFSHSFDHGIRPFVINEEQTWIIAQLSNTHDLEKRDLDTGEIISRKTLPVNEGVGEHDWDFEAPHHGLAMSSNDEILCVAGRASDYAGIVDSDTLANVKTVPVGDAPSWSAIYGDDKFCVLANTRSDDISIVNLREAKEVARIKVGRGPKHITIADMPTSILN